MTAARRSSQAYIRQRHVREVSVQSGFLLVFLEEKKTDDNTDTDTQYSFPSLGYNVPMVDTYSGVVDLRVKGFSVYLWIGVRVWSSDSCQMCAAERKKVNPPPDATTGSFERSDATITHVCKGTRVTHYRYIHRDSM